MIKNTGASYIVYGLTSVQVHDAASSLETAASSGKCVLQSNTSLLLSGGLVQWSDTAGGPIPMGIVTGILHLDAVGREFAAELVASMIRLDDRVWVVDEVVFGTLPPWATKARDSGGRVTQCLNSVIAEMDDCLFASLNPFSHALPSSGISVIAFAGPVGELEHTLRTCVVNASDAVDALRSFGGRYSMEASPETQQLAGFRLWARLGGFDDCDLVVELRGVDAAWLNETMAVLARRHKITLFKGNGLDDAESKAFLTEGKAIGPLPSTWTRITQLE